MKMRRVERQITDPYEIRKCLETADHMVVAMRDGEHIYVVPVNYGFEENDGNYVLYFHGAKEGRKAKLANHDSMVGFEMDINSEIITADTACSHSQRYLSIIGEGILSTVPDGSVEKAEGLGSIMKRITGRSDWDFPEAQLQCTNVYRIEVSELSCKARK